MFIVDQKCPSFHQSESLDGSESEFPFGVVEETPSSTQKSFNLDYNPTIAPIILSGREMVMNLSSVCGVCMSIMYVSPKSVCIKDLGYKCSLEVGRRSVAVGRGRSVTMPSPPTLNPLRRQEHSGRPDALFTIVAADTSVPDPPSGRSPPVPDDCEGDMSVQII